MKVQVVSGASLMAISLLTCVACTGPRATSQVRTAPQAQTTAPQTQPTVPSVPQTRTDARAANSPPDQSSNTTEPKAASEKPGTPRASAGSDSPKVFTGEGVVERVYRDIDAIQINHGEIKGFMPPMSMPYKVRDKALLDVAKPGDKVTFKIQVTGTGYFVSEISKASS